jgi:hypothetical protein
MKALSQFPSGVTKSWLTLLASAYWKQRHASIRITPLRSIDAFTELEAAFNVDIQSAGYGVELLDRAHDFAIFSNEKWTKQCRLPKLALLPAILRHRRTGALPVRAAATKGSPCIGRMTASEQGAHSRIGFVSAPSRGAAFGQEQPVVANENGRSSST